MARVSTRFRQADVAKALKGALAAGFDVGAVEIGADGMIRIVRNTEKAKNSSDPFDQWKASRDAR
ncbi:hypothetical protein [Brevundimonas sp. TWP2-3-4b2]|uniref:hypothetical protein n=1 Tax=Brevundimonas sp. TWP2-3-4b2 TaxID=2804595 RepID=UPI003CEE3FCD